MTAAVVWSADQPVSRARVYADAALALAFHFRRLATGAIR